MVENFLATNDVELDGEFFVPQTSPGAAAEELPEVDAENPYNGGGYGIDDLGDNDDFEDDPW